MGPLDLWGEIERCQQWTERALSESKERGERWAQAEAAYCTVKAEAAYRLEGEGKSASMIAMVLKGQPEVNAAMLERDRAYVEHRNAQEAVNVYKKKLDTLREQYAREWGQEGRRP